LRSFRQGGGVTRGRERRKKGRRESSKKVTRSGKVRLDPGFQTDQKGKADITKRFAGKKKGGPEEGEGRIQLA